MQWAAVRFCPRSEIPAEGNYDWNYKVNTWCEQHGGSLATFARTTGTPSRIALEDLFGHPSRWRPHGPGWIWPSPHPDAFLDAFRFGPIDVFLEIARVYGGDHVMMWTTCGAVVVLAARAHPSGEVPDTHRTAFRLAPLPSGRRAGQLAALESFLAGSPLQVHFERLRGLLEGGARVSIAAWLACFGFEGLDDGDVWPDFEEVAARVLRGEAAPSRALKRVNAVLQKRLTAKATPRKLAEAAFALRKMGPWPKRFDAVRLAWRLDAVGLPSGKGAGLSASMGRLLACYPADLLRDNVFCALSGLETEAANGHPWVDAWFRLAENAHRAGMTVAVYPARLRKRFYRAFGLAREDGEEGENWTAEAFVDLGEPVPLAPIEKWFGDEGADGLLVRAEADGTCRAVRFGNGPEMPQSETLRTTLRTAAMRLDGPGLLAALTLPGERIPGRLADLLSPGSLPPEHGEKSADPARAEAAVGIVDEHVAAPADPARAEAIRIVDEHVAAAADPARAEKAAALLGDVRFEPVDSFWPLLARHTALDAGLPFQEMTRARAPSVVCRLTLPSADDAVVLVEAMSEVKPLRNLRPWCEGPDVWLAGHGIPLSPVLAALGDAGGGTRLAFAVRGKGSEGCELVPRQRG